MSAGVNAYNDKKYADAAAAFEKVVAAEPYNRDALYNLSNTYLAMKDGPKLAATAAKLVAIEPLSENAAQAAGRGLQAERQGGRRRQDRGKGPGAAADVKASEFSRDGARGHA